MRSHLLRCVVFISAIVISVAASAGGQSIIWQDNFESYVPGTFPSSGGFQILHDGFGTAYQTVDNSIQVSGSNSLKLEGACGWAAETYREVVGMPSRIQLQAKVRLTQLEAACAPFQDAIVGFVNWPNYATTIHGASFAGGLINGTMPFNYDHWYSVRVDLDTVARTFSVWIDGQNVQPELTYTGDNPNAIFLTAHNSRHTRVWYDDIKVVDISTLSSLAYYDGFEDGDGWDVRWGQDLPSLQTLVSTPTHTGSGALEFRSTIPGSCHSSRYRVGFEASSGYYSVWVNQRHHQAGFGIYIQVQPGTNPDPIYRESYYFVLQAANGEAPQVMNLMRRHEDGSGEILAQTPTTFLKDEWIQVFVHRKAGGLIECGYVRNGTTHSMTAMDPNPISEPGAFYLWACSDVSPYTYFDDVSYNPDAFCEDFEDGNGWNGRWHSAVNNQFLVGFPTHSGNRAIRLRGSSSNSDCHSATYRDGFSASVGAYSAWAIQQHYQAGFGMFIQVQAGANPNPYHRKGYHLLCSAQDSQLGTFNLYRQNGDGSSSIIGTISPTFQMNEWVNIFIRRLSGNQLVAGYIRSSSGFRDSIIVTDPNPLFTEPGAFYIWSCSDVFPTDNSFDDISYNPDALGTGCAESSMPPITLHAPYKSVKPTVDGTIEANEWQGASVNELMFIYYPDGSIQSMPVKLCHDSSSLYVAARAPFASDPYFWYGLEIDGNHSHTLNGSLTEPHVIVNYNKAGTDSPAASYYDEYRVIQDGCATYSVPTPIGAAHAYSVSGANELSFEFKVPLADLTVNPGGTAGLAIVVGVDATSGNNWSFPVREGCNVGQWANLVIDTAIATSCCIGSRGNVNNSVAQTPDLSDLSLLVAYLTQTPKPTLPCPDEANVNGSVAVAPDLSDLSLLIAYLTQTPRPIIPACSLIVEVPESGPASIGLSTSESAGHSIMTVQTAEPLLGLLLKVRTEGDVKSLLDSEIDIVTERSGEDLTILAIDLQGDASLASGTLEAFSFTERFEIISAEGSTLDFHTVYASTGNPATSLPSRFSLSQNYPNPFNPTTEISYSVPVAGHVRLDVFNVAGQRVATLVDADQATGVHTVQWDAGQFASGLYLYRMSAGEFVETKKMLLLK